MNNRKVVQINSKSECNGLTGLPFLHGVIMYIVYGIYIAYIYLVSNKVSCFFTCSVLTQSCVIHMGWRDFDPGCSCMG